jgi:anthranilate synthase component 1
MLHRLEQNADLETPVSAYLKLRTLDAWSFLLESVEGREHWAHYSIIGVGARATASVREHILHGACEGQPYHTEGADAWSLLRAFFAHASPVAVADAPPFVGGMFGFVSYDAVRCCENIGDAGADPGHVPDALFVVPEVLLVFDNRTYRLTLYAHDAAWLEKARVALRGALPPHQPSTTWQTPVSPNTREDFMASVVAAKEHICAGDIIQVVLSRRFETPRCADPFDVYRGLRTINPSPYLFYFQTPALQLAGASPEVMVRVSKGCMVVRPIAGTRPRGADEAQDKALEADLRADPKEIAEHVMLVDLGRNDVGRVSEPGSVRVHDVMHVERYSHVMHLVSEVQGQLQAPSDAFDALKAAFPAGTLSGAPKVRAMQIIEQLEKRRRGIYGGAVGYFGPDGDADFGIAIRTLEAHPHAFVMQAGAGIVADSNPETEAHEVEHKIKAVMRAAQWAASSEAAW